MAETGVLPLDARVELLNGEILDMSPIGPFHGGVVTYLNEVFSQARKGRWLTSILNPVHLSDISEPQPDLMLLKSSPDFYRRHHPRPEDVYLLIEVSDTSVATDRDHKLPAYGRAGIPEVWIVNLNDQTVEVYREPHFTGYASTTTLRSGQKTAPRTFPDAVVDISELLRH